MNRGLVGMAELRATDNVEALLSVSSSLRAMKTETVSPKYLPEKVQDLKADKEGAGNICLTV